jgi:hypothetical protein
VPITRQTSDKEEHWINDILEEWKKLPAMKRITALRKYMKYVHEWSVFGGHFFNSTVS